MTLPKEIRKIAKAAKEQGWREDETASGHPRFWPSDHNKKPCTFSGTPGDQRALRNFLKDMVRSGLIWPWPPPKRKKG